MWIIVVRDVYSIQENCFKIRAKCQHHIDREDICFHKYSLRNCSWRDDKHVISESEDSGYTHTHIHLFSDRTFFVINLRKKFSERREGEKNNSPNKSIKPEGLVFWKTQSPAASLYSRSKTSLARYKYLESKRKPPFDTCLISKIFSPESKLLRG